MTIILILLTLTALAAGFGLPKVIDDIDLVALKRALKATGAVLAGVSLFWVSYYSVPAGSRGVLLRFGAVTGVLDEGPHLVVPFIDTVERVEVQTQKEEATASAASKDLQTVSTQVAINFHVEPHAVGKLYRNIGMGYASRIIDPAVQETVKAVVAQYTAEELIRLRSKVKAELDEGLAQRLRPYDLIIEGQGVSLKNFDFSGEFNKSIELKQVAQQTAEKARYVLQQAEIDAKTKVTEARGQAEASRIRAAALNANGGSKVLAQQWIEKWNGTLPTVSGTGGGFMLNLSDLMKDSGAATGG